MDRNNLKRAIDLLYGRGGQRKLADALGIAPKTVQRWVASGEVPEWAEIKISALLKIAGPGEDASVQDAAAAIREKVDGIIATAVDRGWNRSMVLRGLLLEVERALADEGRDAGLACEALKAAAYRQADMTARPTADIFAARPMVRVAPGMTAYMRATATMSDDFRPGDILMVRITSGVMDYDTDSMVEVEADTDATDNVDGTMRYTVSTSMLHETMTELELDRLIHSPIRHAP